MPSDNTNPAIDYIRKLYARQDTLLAGINDALAAQGITKQIGPDEGKILQMLIILSQVDTIVEVGTLAGYSTIWMARATSADGRVYTIEKDPRHIAAAAANFAKSDVRDKIIQLEGEADKQLAILAGDGPFDMIFIDADKAAYGNYLDWAEKNLRQYGLVVADNTLLFGAAAQDTPPEGTNAGTWNAMREFNQRLADEDKYFTIMLPTNDGMTVAIKLF